MSPLFISLANLKVYSVSGYSSALAAPGRSLRTLNAVEPEGLVTPDLGVRDFEISKIQFRFQDFSQDFMISLLMFSFLLDFKDFDLISRISIRFQGFQLDFKDFN